MSDARDAAALGGIQHPEQRDTTMSAGAMEDLGVGEVASDDGGDRAMTGHIDRTDRMVGDDDFSDGEPDDASDGSGDDLDLNTGALEEER